MAINVIVQYNGGFLPDILLLLTQAPIVVWLGGIIIVYYYYLFNYVLYCLLSCCCVWWPGMTISSVSVQYDGGSLPDIIILVTQGYCHRGTHLNVMKRFCICSLPV